MLSVTPEDKNAHALVTAAWRASSTVAPPTVRHFSLPWYAMHTSQVAASSCMLCHASTPKTATSRSVPTIPTRVTRTPAEHSTQAAAANCGPMQGRDERG